MRFFKVIIVALLLLPGVAYAGGEAKETYGNAEKYLASGENAKAEEALKRLIQSEPNNAKYHQLLGDAYRKEGKPAQALDEYKRAKGLGAENSELYKGMGTAQKWMKNYKDAAESYKRALQINPRDGEAADDLKSLEQRKGLKLTARIGGWEADYTKSSYEGMVSYGGFDKLDLNAGYSYADQTYYKRSKLYANGYYFYNPASYFKTSLAYKDYNYPVDPAVQKPNPDSNSYDKVPSIEFEVSHWLRDDIRGSLAYEFFRPSFFYDKDSHANNHKISAEAYYITPLKYLRLKAMYAVLRDPDSGRTTIKGRGLNMPAGQVAASTNVKYQTQSLLGGGVEYLRDRWNAEVKYLPNRDLDSSYKYSVLAGLGYDFTDRITGRLDYVYDKYSSKSAYSGKTANVYLASVYYKLNPSVDLGVGYKFIDLPTKNENTGFLTATYKTGLVF